MRRFIKNLESIADNSLQKFKSASALASIFAMLACETPASPTRYERPYCKGNMNMYCSWDPVTRITDGDTLHVLSKDRNDITIRIALAMAPERDQSGYQEANAYHAYLCPVGFRALVDQDDGQPFDRFGRMVAVVWCYDRFLLTYVRSSEAMIKSGHAILDRRFCGVSEFGKDEWARKLGCPP